MTIVSWQFALFVACALAVQRSLVGDARLLSPVVDARLLSAVGDARLLWMLAVSYAFCAALGAAELATLVALTVANWAIGTRLARTAESGASARRRLWLWCGITLDVAVLLAMRAARDGGPAIVAGLSFYALQAISYLADTYSGALRQRPSFLAFATYLAWFPKLLAGPIERPRAFFEQLAQPAVVDAAAVASAATLILTGMTRKLVIADPLAALLPNDAFSSHASLVPGAAAFALVVYAFVLYNDFAGYTQIVRGVSRLFGVELSRNFVRPFAAASFAEFWTRWHVTLSLWLRDYVYLPISRHLIRRNPKLWNLPNLVVPSMATMLVSGVWHGGSANMMIWGGLHGSYLVAERLVTLLRRSRARSHAASATAAHRAGHGMWSSGVSSAWRRLPAVALVFALSTLTLVFFRMEADVGLRYLLKAVEGVGAEPANFRLLVLMVPSVWLDWMEARHGDDTLLDHWRWPARSAAVALAVLACFLMSRATAGAPFIYQTF